MNKKFEEWLRSYAILKAFKNVPFSMQWGTYLEFFDSVGIRLDKIFIELYSSLAESIEDAQKEAINKAFEILNK